MKDLIEFITKSLVDDPSQVNIIQSSRGAESHIQVRVAKEDMGRVIGKSGRVANAMRILLYVAATQQGRRVSLDIDEPE
ncbi:MAG: KH domain-containing protein [Chloroflexota bacterium]|jgi:predicted RNA-binding protein YlqC (UPF0109 family)